METATPPVTYRTQIGLFTAGTDQPCAVTMEVDAFEFKERGSSQARFLMADADGNSMGAVLIGEREMKRLVMQLLMALG